MDIEYLKRFIVVGKNLNFSKASEELFISQPALSHSISLLEKKLGVPLLERSTKFVRLTQAGEMFLPVATEIVRLYQGAVNELMQKFSTDSSELNIGYIGPAMDNLFSPWIHKFSKLSPCVNVQVMRYSGLEIKQAFEQHLIQLGILYEMNVEDIPGLEYRKVGREKYMLVINSAHPLSCASRIGMCQLKDEPFLICDRSFSPKYYDRIMSICKKRGLEPKVTRQVRQISDDLLRSVSAGLGIAIISHSELRTHEIRGIRFIDIDDGEDLFNDIVMAWSGSLSPVARCFRDMAVEMREVGRT